MPDYSGSQVLFNKLLHSMKIIQARKISTVDKQIKRLTVEEQINVWTIPYDNHTSCTLGNYHNIMH